ncbi:type II toxin-antitoxin system VapC family toxin [Sorangium sp. So ce1182]|uniref:type II toxin-antitoxin system VapC family toxin n=1 Tax=Sorangium sp. So ce1182 TaxID=3133334 RepID=UPI003F63AC6C
MIVLDTHAWFWLVASPDRLSEQAADAIDRADRLGVSAVSCWEIAMLAEKGRVELDRPAQRWLEDALASSGTLLLPIDPAIAALAARLPLHGDPADRLIVATAMTANAELITKDHQIRSARLVPTIW